MWDTAEFALARWIAADDPKVLDKFVKRPRPRRSPTTSTAIRCSWRATNSISTTPRERAPGIGFTDVKDRHANGQMGVGA